MTRGRWPSHEEFVRERLDLDPGLRRLREAAPVSRITLADGEEAWLVTGWEEARRVLSEPVFSRAAAVGAAEGNAPTFLIDMDPPDHTRVRRHVVRAFTHRRVQAMRPRVEGVAGRLLDGVEARGRPVDLVEEFALPLPVTVICELLGVPMGDRRRFQRWSDAFLSVSAYSDDEVRDAQRSLDAFLAELVERRREEPEDDLLSALVHLRDEDGGLDERELVHLGVGLLIAGYETTATQISNFAYVLLTRPEQWERLRRDPGLLPGALEELLRFVPLGSETGLPRVATRDVRLGGVLVRAGDTVMAARTAASRDEKVFGDGERLDLGREENPHLAFGYGLHHCVGAHLARLELQVAFSALLRRFPGLRLAVPEPEVRWKDGLVVRGPAALPVTW
ncbi:MULTISPECIES: cytochrome P450 [Actinomadura]|uniref:Cytochrome P450 n=1 Tax=Actinomadura yumaensis TaxID=111807 RepID=A0ABW2CV97_9ACTN|nr:cytochrome P450 [Actinomadura sp. J1-007]MWK34136.1 cytochrome P450 [Actinomadura sp. J1-007]